MNPFPQKSHLTKCLEWTAQIPPITKSAHYRRSTTKWYGLFVPVCELQLFQATILSLQIAPSYMYSAVLTLQTCFKNEQCFAFKRSSISKSKFFLKVHYIFRTFPSTKRKILHSMHAMRKTLIYQNVT